ncbi:hypothetical protein AVEN_140470-1 [Araneus ventricosus]|uniref:Uncharacterized protein n=1 Tax=Araneus ventricosus TaxID=182803 RepID=A0A4Y2JGD3_ARAVE|nr:hypothetical protein AVEN_140470-1 [Araneus ventricosus]
MSLTLVIACDNPFGRSSDMPSSPNEYTNNQKARLETFHAFAREGIKLSNERIETSYDFGATDHVLRRVIKSGCITRSKGMV